MTKLSKLEQTLKQELIDRIQEYDILIQSRVEEDEPKHLEDLIRLSIEELEHYLDIQETILKFLTEDEPNNYLLN